MNERESDELIDLALEAGPVKGPWFPRCPNCFNDWHGLPNEYGCPGSYQVNTYEISAFKEAIYDEAGRWGN